MTRVTNVSRVPGIARISGVPGVARVAAVGLSLALQESIAHNTAEVLSMFVGGVVVAPGEPTDPVSVLVEEEFIFTGTAECNRMAM